MNTPTSPDRGTAPASLTIADFEKALLEMFKPALASGEAFLDVSARALCRAVTGPEKSTKGFGACCNLMRRMMIPGDHELSSTYGHNSAGLLIRFRLPR